jgi:hypothetical protein
MKQIAARAEQMNIYSDEVDCEMDLAAVHAKLPLDLDKLLKFSDFNFLHDCTGIRDKLNRRTGNLTDDFLPRCAR